MAESDSQEIDNCEELETTVLLTQFCNAIKVKVSPLQAMKAHGGCGCKGPHIHSHGTRKR